MAEISLSVGMRTLKVTCDEREIKPTSKAAELLSETAKRFEDDGVSGPLQILLMSGIVLADKVLEIENEVGSTDFLATGPDKLPVGGACDGMNTDFLQGLAEIAEKVEVLSSQFSERQPDRETLPRSD